MEVFDFSVCNNLQVHLVCVTESTSVILSWDISGGYGEGECWLTCIPQVQDRSKRITEIWISISVQGELVLEVSLLPCEFRQSPVQLCVTWNCRHGSMFVYSRYSVDFWAGFKFRLIQVNSGGQSPRDRNLEDSEKMFPSTID